ncbi:MAG: BrnT family toxin, partial [Neisseriaceae bacterium]|nr:BrnT family toxin [Neisseriaceae bacterium]
MQFEWDEKKAADNIKKHGIVFNDAAFVFADEHRIEWFDNRQDYGEDRFNTVGMVFGVLLCV